MLDKIKEVLEYNPNTGEFTWLSNKYAKKVVPHTRAGCVNSSTGYRHISVFKKRYLEHRLAWYMYYGELPKGQIDHINQNREDNRIVNLREVSVSENARNRKARPSKTGVIGVHYLSNIDRYRAVITLNGKKVFQKTFKTCEEAAEARELALKELNLT